MPYVTKPRPYKKEYEKYDGTPAVKKKRAERNQARADVYDYVERVYNLLRRYSTTSNRRPAEFE